MSIVGRWGWAFPERGGREKGVDYDPQGYVRLYHRKLKKRHANHVVMSASREIRPYAQKRTIPPVYAPQRRPPALSRHRKRKI